MPIFLNKAKNFLFLLPALAIFLLSCNEDPTVMGSSLLRDTVTIYPLSSNTDRLITKMGSFRYDISVFNNSIINIGKSDPIKAVSLIRFDEPALIVDTLDFFYDFSVDDIISCKIELLVNRYAFGDSLNPNSLAFKAYEVQYPWYQNTTWDSINNETRIDYSKALGEFKGMIQQRDSIPPISFDFDKQTLLNWFKIWIDNRKNETIDKIVWGLAFVPDESSSVIRQFAGSFIEGKTSSRLSIVYQNNPDIQDTLNIDMSATKTFYDLPEFDTEEMLIQGGTEIRSFIDFDFSMIPPLSAIHTAQLELTIDEEISKSGNFGYDLSLAAGIPIGFEYSKVDSFINKYSAERIGSTFYFKSITSAVETWNRNTGDSFGKGSILFFPDGEKNKREELDMMFFHGVNSPDSSKRPKLTIIYSIIQNPEK